MPDKQIVCLANSRKTSGRCIAGKELRLESPGPWIRPISARSSEEVSEYERQYQDGSDPQVLDIINVPLLSAKPNAYQPENWLLDPESYWEKTGRLNWHDLKPLADDPTTLWENSSSSTRGRNDRVPSSNAVHSGCSLYFLYVDDLKLRVFAPGIDFGNRKRRVQAVFTYGSASYELWVTDPIFERQYLAGSDGEFPIGECYLSVSLGEPYDDGYCYKFVAAIITSERART